MTKRYQHATMYRAGSFKDSGNYVYTSTFLRMVEQIKCELGTISQPHFEPEIGTIQPRLLVWVDSPEQAAHVDAIVMRFFLMSE